MEETFNAGKDNMFVELAKVKSQQPTSLRIDTDESLGYGDDSEGQLTVDVYQTKDELVVQSAVAGVKLDDLEINISNESVTIRGKREKTETVSSKDYYYQECFWGTFSRSIILPTEVDPDKSTAAIKSGVLTIRMPKMVKSKAKKLKVKSVDE